MIDDLKDGIEFLVCTDRPLESFGLPFGNRHDSWWLVFPSCQSRKFNKKVSQKWRTFTILVSSTESSTNTGFVGVPTATNFQLPIFSGTSCWAMSITLSPR